MPDIRIYGVRHHGPGSARSLRTELDAFLPDCVLVEGPPDATDLAVLAGSPGMVPPVALLVYRQDDTSRAAFYPFAAFSPEWTAMRHAAAAGVPCRFVDLPQSVQLAEKPWIEIVDGDVLSRDPLGELARAAGYDDGERWWDEVVESRSGDAAGVFEAVAEAMAALREDEAPQGAREEAREAHMRAGIRTAAAEGFARIAVVCGAWHVPALLRHDARGQASRDAATLRGLARVKTAAAWVPWSYERLSSGSGYGAGVTSPEWYHAVWEHGDQLAARWLASAAHQLRAADLDASPASVIQAARLAQALADMRGRARPLLADLDEAALASLCYGDEAPMGVIRRRLVIGERLGEVPEDAPVTPVQADFTAQARKLKLAPEAGARQAKLDLRKELDLARSHLLHRTALLGIAWGTREAARGTGTFAESWHLAWKPEFQLELVAASRHGSTVEEAAAALACRKAEESPNVAGVAGMIGTVFEADLPDAAARIVAVLADRSALATDVFDLMDALPPLAGLARYGSVRATDTEAVRGVVAGIVPRISAGLLAACQSLDDDAALQAARRIPAAHQAVVLLEDAAMRADWLRALGNLAGQEHLHGRVVGKANRILFDASGIDAGEAGIRLRRALSAPGEATAVAAWVEGFLESSGAVLVHGSSLLPVVDEWLSGMDPDRFMEILPILRRTFSTFTKAERHDIGDRIKAGAPVRTAGPAVAGGDGFPVERAARVVPVLRLLLGAAA